MVNYKTKFSSLLLLLLIVSCKHFHEQGSLKRSAFESTFGQLLPVTQDPDSVLKSMRDSLQKNGVDTLIQLCYRRENQNQYPKLKYDDLLNRNERKKHIEPECMEDVRYLFWQQKGKQYLSKINQFTTKTKLLSTNTFQPTIAYFKQNQSTIQQERPLTYLPDTNKTKMISTNTNELPKQPEFKYKGLSTDNAFFRDDFSANVVELYIRLSNTTFIRKYERNMYLPIVLDLDSNDNIFYGNDQHYYLFNYSSYSYTLLQIVEVTFLRASN